MAKSPLKRTLVDIDAAAEYLGLTPRTVRRWIADGDIRGYRVGGHAVRLDVADMEALVRPIPTVRDTTDLDSPCACGGTTRLSKVLCEPDEAFVVLKDIADPHGVGMETHAAVVVDRAIRRAGPAHRTAESRHGRPEPSQQAPICPIPCGVENHRVRCALRGDVDTESSPAGHLDLTARIRPLHPAQPA